MHISRKVGHFPLHVPGQPLQVWAPGPDSFAATWPKNLMKHPDGVDHQEDYVKTTYHPSKNFEACDSEYLRRYPSMSAVYRSVPAEPQSLIFGPSLLVPSFFFSRVRLGSQHSCHILHGKVSATLADSTYCTTQDRVFAALPISIQQVPVRWVQMPCPIIPCYRCPFNRISERIYNCFKFFAT